MGSNVPVLRHLAEEAAQQKSRHVALVYGKFADHVTDISARQGRRDRKLRICLLIFVSACFVLVNVRVDADGVGGYRVVCFIHSACHRVMYWFESCDGDFEVDHVNGTACSTGVM